MQLYARIIFIVSLYFVGMGGAVLGAALLAGEATCRKSTLVTVDAAGIASVNSNSCSSSACTVPACRVLSKTIGNVVYSYCTCSVWLEDPTTAGVKECFIYTYALEGGNAQKDCTKHAVCTNPLTCGPPKDAVGNGTGWNCQCN